MCMADPKRAVKVNYSNLANQIMMSVLSSLCPEGNVSLLFNIFTKRLKLNDKKTLKR